MSRWLTLALVLSVTACRSTQKAPSEPLAGSGSAVAVGSGSGSGADPWKAVDAAAPLDPKTRAEQAIARLSTIQPKLAALRELPLDTPVPAEYQTTDDFRAFMRKGLAKELPPEKAANTAQALHHLGFFKELVDLPKVLEQTMATQAAAYYDPGTKKFFVVMVPDSDLMLDTISAHELTHALQDKHFDLTKYLPPDLDDDQGIARRFIAEGDATFAMFAYMATDKAGPSALPKLLKLLGGQLETMASQSTAGYAEMMKEQAAMMPGLDADMKKSMESIQDLPPMIVGPLIDSYLKGALVAMDAYEAKGWKGVDALYTKPPTSTEQVLHPKTKLIPTREEPRQVTLPKLDGTELTRNVVGELQWSIYFQQWDVKQPDAAPGWGGDHYAVMKGKDGKLVGYIATTWDTPKDAEEFEAAYKASVAARFPSGARDDGAKVFIKRAGKNVFIVDGGTDAKAVDRLAAATKIK
jgi:hypothetical protein